VSVNCCLGENIMDLPNAHVNDSKLDKFFDSDGGEE
jgi:hypothetical protein